MRGEMRQKNCQDCGNEFFVEVKRGKTNKKFCDNCLKRKAEARRLRANKYDNYLTCKICGFKASTLRQHIVRAHNIKMEDYYSLYNATVQDVYQKETLNRYSENFKGEKNPFHNHQGKLSPFSKDFIKYQDLTDDEKKREIRKITTKVSKTRKINNNVSTNLDYWLEKTEGNIQEAKNLLKERQATFSKEKCIKKYGEINGLKIWKERQLKWLKSYKRNNFSLISQKLFWSIYEEIKRDFNEIYFAQLEDNIKNESGQNFEYRLDINISYIKPDFFIKDNNKIIEFQGDYWHGEARGNQKREQKRNQAILDAGYELLEINERDYRKDPEITLNRCLEFIYG